MSRPTIRDDLAALEGYHSPQVEVEVRLNTNEAPSAPPAGFTDALIEATRAIEWHRYPDRSALALRTAIGELHGVEAGRVFCANGSNEVLQTILLTFAGPGRSVLTFEPTYALHGHIARITGAATIEGTRNDRFELDPGYAVDLVHRHRPAVTFLCSPNNPTGLVEPRSTVEAVLAAVASVGGLLVVDEAYGQFAPWSAQELQGDETPLVVSRTYSKTWAMAGARLGYLLAPDWLIYELDKVVLPYHLDSMKQAAGLAALDFLSDMESRVAGIIEERGMLEAALLNLDCEVFPSGANFVLFRPPGGDGSAIWQGLLDQSVLVRNTSSWERLDGCLRVTVGEPKENRRFLDALGLVLDQPARQEQS
ncbi:MAG: histidinol-phosphate aminotransferase [Acidimicrobiales bacterium]|jgi:histidinol-phosphate aminotransferase